jgi:hypothetical protein
MQICLSYIVAMFSVLKYTVSSHVRNSITLLVRAFQAVMTLVKPAQFSHFPCDRQEVMA